VIEAKRRPVQWSRATVETIRNWDASLPQALLYPLAKRWVDVFCAAVFLLILSPVMGAIALAIRLDSSGPAIFKQMRVGKRGREFVMYKFRSMHANADDKVHRRFAEEYINGNGKAHAAHDTNPHAPVYKPNGDGRITRVGRWLRRTSLDELPQLLNVIRGEMSLVGPRPAVPYEVEQYSERHLRRLAVLPGLTGLAQISGRSGLTFEKIVRLDIDYIDRRSLGLDLAILLRTVPVVVQAKCSA
jgi:lipopolysaccharide/colanic/teichoic acid biosynthesis glycosyltransferase